MSDAGPAGAADATDTANPDSDWPSPASSAPYCAWLGSTVDRLNRCGAWFCAFAKRPSGRCTCWVNAKTPSTPYNPCTCWARGWRYLVCGNPSWGKSAGARSGRLRGGKSIVSAASRMGRLKTQKCPISRCCEVCEAESVCPAQRQNGGARMLHVAVSRGALNRCRTSKQTAKHERRLGTAQNSHCRSVGGAR